MVIHPCKLRLASQSAGQSVRYALASIQSLQIRYILTRICKDANANMTALFDKNAPIIMGQLIHDFGLTPTQAAGLMGNIAHESGGLAAMIEIGGGSGRGMCQWSGSRAVQFEAWCHKLGKTIHDIDANYSFLKHELQTTQAASIVAVKHAASVEAATEAFMRVFERPGIPALSSRIRWARMALAAYQHVHGAPHTVQRRH